MGRDYYEQRDARVNICGELARRGWKIYGYKEDQSDSMTDYYSPADWDGVAEKDGVVVCVSVADWTVKHCSGGRELCRSVKGETCTRCDGTGFEPDGWTLLQAQANPPAYHKHWSEVEFSLTGSRVVAGMTSVVSPIHFHDRHGGAEKCHTCKGVGHSFNPEHYIEPWPTFQATPRGAKWHVERGGKILAKGIGLKACQDTNDHIPDIEARIEAAVKALVDKMEAATFKDSPTPGKGGPAKPAATPSDASATLGKTGAWTWLTFTTKPAQEMLDSIKADGWRWSHKRCAWYNLDGKMPPAGISYVEQTA